MRLRDGTWPGHILEHVALELQNLAGMKTGFGKARMTGERGVYKVVIRAREEASAGRPDGGARPADGRHQRPPVRRGRHHRPAGREGRPPVPGPQHGQHRGRRHRARHPFIRLNDGNLVQLGYGAASAASGRPRPTAPAPSPRHLARQGPDQAAAGRRGVPVPEGQVVESADEAWEAAQDIGLPVVVKPSDGNHARGVSLDLSTQGEWPRPSLPPRPRAPR
jgi:cyanophycin synthetase